LIEGCIKLAESALGSSKTQQNPEVLNPPLEQSGDMLSGVDRVDSMLVDCIKIAESTLQNKKQKLGGGICGGSGKTNPPDLFGWYRFSPGNLRILHRNLLTIGFLNQTNPYLIRTLINS